MTQRVKLTEPQARVLCGQEKFKLFCGGYGSGKSEALVASALRDLKISKGQPVGIYAPTYDQFKLNLMPRFIQALTGKKGKMNYQDMTYTINGLGKLIFRSLNNPDRIIGYEVFRSHIDEIDTLAIDKAEMAWNKIMARNRCVVEGHENRVSGYTTPEGFKFCYQRWEKQNIDGYALYRAPTYSNPYLPDDYIQSLRDTYSEALVNAYIEGQFVNMTSGKVYYFDRELHGTNAAHKKGEPIRVGMDFNVQNMSAGIFVQRYGLSYMVDEIVGALDTPQVCRILKERYPECVITIYPDASGSHGSSKNATESDISILKANGFIVNVAPSNPFIKDRVISVNTGFMNGTVKVNVERCPASAEALEQQVYDRNGMPEKSLATNIDDLNDEFGYYVHSVHPVVRRTFEQKILGGM